MLDFTNLHVGLNNRCVLSCPECTRNLDYIDDIHKLKPTEYFTDFLSDPSIKSILFCGNWGDPIYSKNFLGLIKSIKKSNPNCFIKIHTNGAFKTVKWWEELVECLSDNDYLVFSIDGIPENYTNYRKNSNWESVKSAIETVVSTRNKLKKKLLIEWKYIVFSYNEDTIVEAYKLSKSMGFNEFRLVKPLISENFDLSLSRDFEEIKKEFYEKIKKPY